MEAIGIGVLFGRLVTIMPSLLIPVCGAVPLGFAALSGSGIAATQGLFGFFSTPAVQHSLSLTLVGAVTVLGAAAGRTMSPVAAVTLMSAKLTKTTPLDLVKTVAIPLLAGMAAVIFAAAVIASRH